ncbi:MAG: endo alpha-1,4 polygalactosaminidase [Elusimicrobia bacterium]|nr:endo alpha-1,4 polygalactosaminidase [Elusimicrobiota bacterium]
MTGAAAVLLGAVAAAAPLRAEPPRLAQARRWACFYGDNISSRAWGGLDLAVVDPDGFVRPSTSGPAALAYVSAGEADSARWTWPLAKGKDFLVEPNPAWKGAHRVDMRSPQWRELLLETTVSSALAKGYAGVMLDTLDVAEYLESSAPARFVGMKDAAVRLVLDLRQRRPGALILVNNGLALLDGIAGAIDGLVIEDLYTRCHPEPGPCGPTPEEVARSKEAVLKAFVAKTGKPVFVLLYSRAKDRDARWVRKAVERARAAGFRPYLASPSLDRLGTVFPGESR